jgi:hypothetical protein
VMVLLNSWLMNAHRDSRASSPRGGSTKRPLVMSRRRSTDGPRGRANRRVK